MGFEWLPILWATLATLCYGVYLRAPKKVLVSIAIVGGFGYFMYRIMHVVSDDVVFSTFIAACSVGYLSELMARIWRSPAILWVIPGILPLAPGYGLYKTMEYFINSEYNLALEKGLSSLMIAGAISLGIIIMTTGYRLFSNTGSSKHREEVVEENIPSENI